MSDPDGLRRWLASEAGLTGRQFEGAARACEDNFYESIGDLQSASATDLRAAFPGGAIRGKIEAALESAGKSPTESAPVAAMGTLASLPIQLPHGRHYHCFLSHKVAATLPCGRSVVCSLVSQLAACPLRKPTRDSKAVKAWPEQ